ncbi:MAG TPA: Hsp20/alpha crystallin family protein [Phototrophicaceae bacterium]|jgi:HSP20 family protein|nr:Hsp20/alpha crystallin family protein [Phototrophicaceae bacterium]
MANIIRWNPVREMAAMQSLMDRMFDDTWRSVRPFAEVEGSTLALDVHEDKETYVVTTSLPGVSADNIQINLHDDILTIEAEIPQKKVEQEGTRALVQERVYGKYSRQIRLPQAVNSDKVEAQYEDGVLTLTLPKADHVLPRSIPVKRLNNGSANNN